MLLFIDPAGGINYDTVVCLTSVGKSDSIDPVDASSACGPDKSPGKVSISYNFEGQHLQDPDTGKISGTSLRQLLRSKTFFGFKIAPVIPVVGDEIEEGTGYFSELSSTYAFDSVGTFTGTIQPVNQPTITVDNTPPVPVNGLRFYIDNQDNSFGGLGVINITANELFDLAMTSNAPGVSSSVSNTNSFSFNIGALPIGLFYVDFEFSTLVLTGFHLEFLSSNIYDHDLTNISAAEIQYLNFDTNRYPTSKVNEILAICVSYGVTNTGGLFIPNQVPTAPPSGQGITDKNTLLANNWTVITD